MPINDLPKSLIDSVVEVVTKSVQNQNKVLERVVLEGLKKFGVNSISELSEGDQKAFHAWTQLRLTEADCHCGSELEEDDMPGDSVYHDGDDESSGKKKEMDEDDTADHDHDGDGEVETSSQEYLGAKDKAIKAAMKESVALGANEIATNGAVGVGNALLAQPKHADVIHDTDPYSGVTQYRLLLQYATNEGTRIYPPVSLPGAQSIAELRTLVEGLPEFNEAIDAALVANAALTN
jgi:hypothetical protein